MCDKSTISRELKRNQGQRGYRPKQAQELVGRRRQTAHHARISTAHWDQVEALLCQDWSPEQVSSWLDQEEGIAVSQEWIYLYVYMDKHHGGDLYKYLRCQMGVVVGQPSRVNHWGGDTVIGRPGSAVLLILAERKTRQSILALSPDKLLRKRSYGLSDPMDATHHLWEPNPLGGCYPP